MPLMQAEGIKSQQRGLQPDKSNDLRPKQRSVPGIRPPDLTYSESTPQGIEGAGS